MNNDDLTLQGPIITLTYKVAASRREDLIVFLRSATKVYEEPGGIRIALYESVDEPGLFCELVAYATHQAYEKDQIRVEQDERMKKVLDEWHKYFDGPLEVRRLMPIPLTK